MTIMTMMMIMTILAMMIMTILTMMMTMTIMTVMMIIMMLTKASYQQTPFNFLFMFQTMYKCSQIMFNLFRSIFNRLHLRTLFCVCGGGGGGVIQKQPHYEL